VKKVLADEESKGDTSDFNNAKVKTLKETTAQEDSTVETPLSATQLGTLMHKCFEYLIKDRSYWPVGENSGAIEKYVASFVDGLLRKGILSETERNAVQLPFLIGFLRSDRAKEISKAEFACEEVPFTYLLNLDDMFSEEEKSRLDKNFGESSEKSVAIQGVIDLYYKTHDGKFVLADFKTDRLYAGNEELLKDKYSVQLRCYAKALESITGEKISESVLLFVREGKEFIYDHHNKAWRK
jgi:ATP-dependent helicase/nuclease subunit A